MKSDDKRRKTPSIVNDGAFERLKRRAQDVGLIVNTGLKPADIELQTKTTRKLDPEVGRAAEKKMGGRKKGAKK